MGASAAEHEAMPLTPPSLTLGLEEEYLLVDPSSRDLVAAPPEGFMRRCQERLGERVAHELLQAQVEVGTSVCQDVGAARAQLMGLRASVAAIAREFGMAMIAASTHPFASWRAQKKVEKERYQLLARDMQTLASRLVICGMHVHAGIEDEEIRIDLMNQAAYFLPHLLALSTSSPFWQGQPTGLKAYRPTIFGELPRSGLPEYFASAQEWRQMLHLLQRTGLCDDATKIWWDIRPSARFPTLELRICDICTRLDDAITIAALWQSILAMLYRLRARNQTWRRYRRTLVEENKWLAQRHGIGAELADFGALARKPFGVLLEEIIELVRDEAMRLGCLPEVLRAREILDRGTSADRQLEIHARAQAAGASEREAAAAVVDWLIEETMVGIAPDAGMSAASAFDDPPRDATSTPRTEQERGTHGRNRQA
jgi:glutamate---cysteine ligase / carboxylate-amine ligase